MVLYATVMNMVSFIIPAYNEAEHIVATIDSIREHSPQSLEYEIVVVDNGSDDTTAEEAEARGAVIVRAPGVKLGDVRNLGVTASQGDVLIFLDADMSLTPEWSEHVLERLSGLRNEPPVVTGSWCEVAPEAYWAARTWELGQQRSGPVDALGGAHLMVTREGFMEIGGFPPEAESGEDEIFCQRAWQAGIPVIADARLRVIHRGVSSSLPEFFRRHQWHGLGDLRGSEGGLRLSKTSLAVAVFAAAHLLLFFAFFAQDTAVAPISATVGAAVLLGLPAAKAHRALRCGGAWPFIQLSVLYYLTFVARATAWYYFLRGTQPRSRHTA